MDDAVVDNRLRRHLYAFSFADEFGPLFAIYPLFFADCGLTIAQISVVFMVWGSVELTLEIPSGVLADVVDRRRLLAAALLIRAFGISIWVMWPTFWGILIGATLWAAHSALSSGAWEALVFDEVSAVEDAQAYAPVMARVEQMSHTGTALTTLVASALIACDVSMVAIAWLSVFAAFPAVALVLTLPRANALDGEAHDDVGDAVEQNAEPQGFIATLRLGVEVAFGTRQILKLLSLGALLGGLFLVDEYVHLLARVRGAPGFSIPILVAVVWGGLLVGGEVAARKPELSPKALAALLAGGALLMTWGLASDAVWPLLLVALGYGAMQTVWIISDARFQMAIPSPTRATVTSLRAFASGTIGVLVLGVVGVVAVDDDPSPGLVGMAILITLLSVCVRAWVPVAVTDDT